MNQNIPTNRIRVNLRWLRVLLLRREEVEVGETGDCLRGRSVKYFIVADRIHGVTTTIQDTDFTVNHRTKQLLHASRIYDGDKVLR